MMLPRVNIVACATILGYVGAAIAGLDKSAPNTVAVYWGQNSYNQKSGDLSQQRLSYYCDNADIDVLILAFLTQVNGLGGAPVINFANQGDICKTFEGTNLLNCPQIADDIKTCQGKGKTILLSIGGATYSEGGFTSEDAAVKGANLLWDTFGPKGSSSAHRPFGDSVIDGFDLDFEATVNNMVPFSNRLRELMTADKSKKYFLTAAPQCPFPDAANKDMLDGAVSFDAVWVQFYNNFCGVNSFKPGAGNQTSFNFATWDNWAKQTSKNKDVKVIVGVPANTGAAGSGYVTADQLAPVIDYCKGFNSFGGIMMWDATQAYANKGFIDGVKKALKNAKAYVNDWIAQKPLDGHEEL